jgi:hypothetical protein
MSDFSQGPLVEPEGVNAGSAEALDEDGTPPPPDAAVAAGDPDHDDPDAVPRDRDLLGPRHRDLLGAAEPQEEPGGDAGSID